MLAAAAALLAPPAAAAHGPHGDDVTTRPPAGAARILAACGSDFPPSSVYAAHGFSVNTVWNNACGVAEARASGSYVIRLVANGQGDVETMRPSAVRAAAQISAVTGIEMSVAPGTVPDGASGDREPVEGEILISVDATMPCRAGSAGCGGQNRGYWLNGEAQAVYTAGRVWIDPSYTTASMPDRDHLVAHELGHAVGLDHFASLYAGEIQVMHGAGDWTAKDFRAGDRNGLVHVTEQAASRYIAVSPRASDGALVACMASLVDRTSCSAVLWPSNVGTDAAIARLGDGSAVTAFNGAGSQLSACRITGFLGAECTSSGAPIAGTASPAVTTLASGSAIAAFRRASGSLGTCELTPTGPQNCTDHGWVLAPTANPAAARLADGTAAVAFRGGSGLLSACRVTSFGGSTCWSSGVAMASDAEPAVTTLSGGTVVAAFRRASGSLGTCELTPTGPQNCTDHGWVLAPGTTPAALPYRDGSASVVFTGGGNRLSACRVTSFGGSTCGTLPQTVRPQTNPAVTDIS